MKQHTGNFKNEVKNMGRQFDSVIEYDGITLRQELYAVTPLFEANILKSVMKQLDIESSVDIPKGTILNYKLGLLVNGDYEYLDYGNYVVYSSERQEDTKTYKIVCYDKMLYSMKQNEDLGVDYPIKIKDYLIALGRKIGLEVEDTQFANQNRKIPAELYTQTDYTYRDILDDIAQATGSIIVINSNDKIEVKYPSNTNDTIDEEYFKDTNITIKEKYGPVNTIVLSRAGGSDNIYYPEVLPENPIELKIVDNQLMNDNNRVDYLPELYQKLNGLEFYINNVMSTGILYYDVGDFYNIKIGENTYKCLMLNDEINVTSGIEEIIYTNMPEESKTDYTKADKTDRRINQTYIIVDKQNQTIEAVVKNTTKQNQKIARVEQTVDELNSKISDIADITTSQENYYGRLEFENINQSEPIRIEVKPIETNISYLYPNENLFPSEDLFMPDRIIRFTNTKTNEVFEYELPDDLLYYDENNYDEFIWDYESQAEAEIRKCQVNKRVGYNTDGTTYVLTNPVTIEYEWQPIELTDGDYIVELPGYNNAYIFARLMTQNIYTTQFATKVEMNTEITQTRNTFSVALEEKLDEEKFTGANIILSINNDSSGAEIDADRISLQRKRN